MSNLPSYLDETGVKYLWDKTKTHVEESVNALKDEIASGDLIKISPLTIEDIERILSESE